MISVSPILLFHVLLVGFMRKALWKSMTSLFVTTSLPEGGFYVILNSITPFCGSITYSVASKPPVR